MAARFPSPDCFYSVGKFEDAAVQEELTKMVDEFNRDIAGWVSSLMNSRKMRVAASPISGEGVFACDPIDAGVDVMLIPATIQDAPNFKGSRKYCFETEITIKNKKVSIILDGLPALAAMSRIPESQKTAEEKMFDSINASHHNHSCKTPNVEPIWDEHSKTRLPFVAYVAKTSIPRDAELLSDYNAGFKPKNTVPFFRKISDLKKEGCPEHLIQECKCMRTPYASISQKCPKGRGYDKRVMFPADYLEPEAEPEPDAEPSSPKRPRRSSARFA
jgi:hypothetical protein